ncbi:RAVE protein 1 C terminal-domain-containing protein [Jimgerdemannia flammicorona]|uniref:RAVE protein 1 C terminal-domain-containing protein n=1 Tax=Jimgerdemannia flammicorona TaxID=994334 RepID=A0A433DGS0_9FUNG|nr:RAVE protein 1 C terminal-domain-containing protein [Jimgerdemannia flammicorona]
MVMRIAVALHLKVLIFKPGQSDADGTTQWGSYETLVHDLPISCLDWAASGDLLTGGDEINLWRTKRDGDESEWRRVWKQRCASNIKLAKFTPDGTLFATIGQYDRLVKVWYHDQDAPGLETQFRFVYLPHPRSVTNFTWRKSSKPQKDPTENFLFTMARDGICRLWSSTDPTESHMFYMCAVVDPNQSLVTSQSPEDRSISNHPDFFSPIHCIDSKELTSAVQLAVEIQGEGSKQDQMAELRLRRLKEMIRDTPDLLLQVQRDGSLIIWGIQFLNSYPRRIPKVLVVLRVAQALLSSDAEYFAGVVSVYHDHLGVKSKSTIFPVELYFLAQSPHGRLNCYTINLIDFFDSTRFSSRLYLKHSWTGHHGQIHQVIQSNSESYFATLAGDGEVNLWQYEDPKFGLRRGYGLQEQALVSPKIPIKLVTLIPGGRYFATYDGCRIIIYGYNPEDAHCHRICICEDFDPENLLLFLHAFTNANQSGEKSTYLFGLSARSKMTFLWILDIDTDGTFSSSTLIARQTLPMDSEPLFAVALNSWTGMVLTATPPARQNIFVTYSSDDGLIRYWGLVEEGGNVSWTAGPIVESEDRDVKIARFGAVGVLATVSRHDNRDELSIWTRIEDDKAPKKGVSENISDVAWNFSPEAQHLLAVALPAKVQIFGRRRVDTDTTIANWILLAEFAVQTAPSHGVDKIAWTDNGVLIAATGSQLLCYTKWIGSTDVLRATELLGSNESVPTIHELAFRVNGPLPPYHPSVLTHYVMWGKFELVQHILLILHNYLKIVFEHDKEIDRMPPIPFSKFFELDKPESSGKETKYSGLFDDEESDHQDDQIKLSTEATEFLIQELTQKTLPGVSHVEQLYLMAQIESLVQIDKNKGSIDENGARYEVFVKRHMYLNRILPPALRRETLEFRDVVWALHSESQASELIEKFVSKDSLLEYSLNIAGGKLLWKDAKAMGIFLWLEKTESVYQQMEVIARNTYMSKEERDPIDCTLFYLALRKKKLLLGLWKIATHHKEQKAMLNFLANDFEQPRWQKAALKNAFALLGKQRYEYAAAFFLLGDRLRDAVNVCLKHIDDFQLAIAMCRVYEGDNGPVRKEIINSHVLPLAVGTGDRWLASLAFWTLDRRDDSVRAIMAPLDSFGINVSGSASMKSHTDFHDPSLLLLYQYLKDKTKQTRKMKMGISYDMEYDFVVKSASAYERLGNPILALYVLKIHRIEPPEVPKRTKTLLVDGRHIATTPAVEDISTGTADFDDLSWRAPEAKLARAADLFANDDEFSKPARAIDIFAENDPQESAKPSRAVDLFANDNDDIFSSKPRTVSIFDNDVDIFKNSEDPEEFDPDNSTIEKGIIIGLNNSNLDLYKAVLAMQLIQYALHTIADVSEDSAIMILDNPAFQNYLDKVHKGLTAVCDYVKLPKSILGDLLVTKGVETDAFALGVRLLNEGMVSKTDTEKFIQALVNGCSTLVFLIFTAREKVVNITDHLYKWTEHVLSSFMHWQRLIQDAIPPPLGDLQTHKISLSAFLSLSILSLQNGQYEQAWGCIFNARKLYHTLVGDVAGLNNIIKQIISGQARMVDMPPDSDASSLGEESLDDDGQRDFVSDNSVDPLGIKLLEAASVNYIVRSLEMFLNNSEGSVSDDLSAYVLTALLEPLMHTAYCLERDILKYPSEQLSKEVIKKHFKNLRERKFWHSLESLEEVDKLLPFVRSIQNKKSEQVSIMITEHFDSCETLFDARSTLTGFCVNSANPKVMAVCTKTEVHEIDLDRILHTSATVTRSPSVSSLETDANSDADSDEAEEQLVIGSDTEVETSRRLRAREPLAERSRSKPSSLGTDRLKVREEQQQEVYQSKNGAGGFKNLSFDNLQDAWKRSYQTVFNSGGTETPPELAEKPERNDKIYKLDYLKRHVAATTAESHPTFPYYLTGCDVSATNPSVILWQFGQDKELMSYHGSLGKFGQKFGAADAKGSLALWRFDSSLQASKPFYTMICHSKAARDFAFLDSSSFLVTAGTSLSQSKANNLCLWDTLLPAARSLVCVLPAHEAGAYTVKYWPKSRLIISGGKKGEITVTDVRQRSILHTFHAHTARIGTLAFDYRNEMLISGSVDGDLKIWDLATFTERHTWSAQARNRFLNPGFDRIPVKSFGITEIRVLDDGFIYTSGPSGIGRCREAPVSQY